MRLLHTVAGLGKAAGGPAASVTGLCRRMAEQGHDVTLLTGDGEKAPEVEGLRGKVVLASARLGAYPLANFSRGFARQCLSQARVSDVVHTHGVWLHPNWTSAAAARRLAKPLVISPRGMLEPWSLAQSKRRKGLLWRLIERRSFAQAAFVHATGRAEAENMRQLGVTTPIAVIPNGVDLAEEFEHRRIARFKSSAASGGDPEVLFLGRIHPKKGLNLLLEAWRTAGRWVKGARLVICGPGDAAAIAELESQIAAMADSSVQYRGSVSGVEKIELLARASVLVLPSFSENYGMVIAESLAAETPVITTTATPWSELEEHSCGWWIPPELPALLDALERALGRSDEELRTMGVRGRSLIEKEHSLERAGGMMEEAYSWALGRSDRPQCVQEAQLA